jgi:hypothetical protein
MKMNVWILTDDKIGRLVPGCRYTASQKRKVFDIFENVDEESK